MIAAQDMESTVDIVARLALPADAPGLVALWVRFMREESAAVPDAAPESARPHWAARLDTQITKGQALVVSRGRELVGFAAFLDAADRSWIPPHVAYVVDVYVAPEARRTRAAKALFAALMASTQARYAAVWTNTHIRNRRVRVLLTRAGFGPLPGFAITGLEDQVYLQRTL